MSIQDIIEEFEDAITNEINNLPHVSADELGLDRRCGYVWIDEDAEIIVCKISNSNTLNYYGGFEYIDEEYVTTVGNYVIYQEHSRVIRCFEYYFDREPADEE